MKKKIIFPLILAVLLSGLQVNVNAADSAIIEVSAENIYLTAGEQNSIKVKLRNTGDYKVFDVEGFLSSSTPGIDILEDSHKVFSEINKDKTKSYEPVLFVDEGKLLGSYTLSLTLVYKRFRVDQVTTITVPIGVIVNEGYTPKIGFTTDQSKLRIKAGSENQLDLSFTNWWSEEVKDLTFSVSSGNTNLVVVDGLTVAYETANISQTVPVTPTISVIEGTAIGTYSIMVYASYKDLEGNSYYQTYTVPLRLDETSPTQTTTITIQDTGVKQTSVRPGDILELDVVISCSGANSYDALSVLGLTTASPLSPVTPTTMSLGDIEEDGEVTTTYTLLVDGDTSAGQYPVTLTVSYTDSVGAVRTLTETITIMVEGLIEFKLLDVPSTTVYRGETAELDADILLIGTESVQFVSIEVIDNQVFDSVQGSTEYIGAVDPDSPIPFDVKYCVTDDTEEGEYDLELLVTYRDHLNKPHEVKLETGIEISAQNTVMEEKKNGGFWSWLRNLFS
jgi:hypothetical protein